MYYSFTDLDITRTVNELISLERFANTNGDMNFKLQKNLETLLTEALSPQGITINSLRIRFSIDYRTGYYRADANSVTRKPIPYTNTPVRMREFDTEDPEVLVPFYYPANLKKSLHGFMFRKKPTNENNAQLVANRYGASLNRHYRLSKGSQKRYEKYYSLDTAFPRPDISPHILSKMKKYTRKIPRSIRNNARHTSRNRKV